MSMENTTFDPKAKLAALARRAKVHDFDLLIEKCTVLYEILCVANEQVNLTRIDSEEGFWIKHVADSLMLGVAFPDLTGLKLRVGDIGCGAGFPSLVLAMAFPDWKICAIDSIGKKVTFVRLAAGMLDLTNLTAIQGRAVELNRKAEYQNQFDVVTARAVAPSPKIYRETERFTVKNGRWIFYKTPGQAAEELPELQKISKVKWTITPEIELPGDAGSRVFAVGARK